MRALFPAGRPSPRLAPAGPFDCLGPESGFAAIQGAAFDQESGLLFLMHLSGEWGGDLIDVYQFHDDPVDTPPDFTTVLQQMFAHLKQLLRRLVAVFG